MWSGYLSASSYWAPPLRPSVIIVGPPKEEAISLLAMKQFLKQDQTTVNDDRIASLIVSARVHAERHTHRSFTKKPFLMSLSRFPNISYDKTDRINLWYPPLTSDVSIVYIDIDGNAQTLYAGRDFQVDYAGEPGRVAPLAQTPWPQTKWGVLNSVRIYYTAGYEVNSNLRLEADAVAVDTVEPETDQVNTIPAPSQVTQVQVDRTIPNDLVNGMMELVSHWYQNRAPVQAIPGAGGAYQILPWHVEKIFDDYVFDTLTPTVSPDF
jgi:uncharacterized phiE125 gp8 family phage protein